MGLPAYAACSLGKASAFPAIAEVTLRRSDVVSHVCAPSESEWRSLLFRRFSSAVEKFDPSEGLNMLLAGCAEEWKGNLHRVGGWQMVKAPADLRAIPSTASMKIELGMARV